MTSNVCSLAAARGPRREAAHDLERERLVAHQRKLLTEQTLVVRVRVDQQNVRMRHADGKYNPPP